MFVDISGILVIILRKFYDSSTSVFGVNVFRYDEWARSYFRHDSSNKIDVAIQLNINAWTR